MELERIEIVEDRTAESRCDEGFLTLHRLVVRNRYADGSASEPYACDLVRRPGSDAVVAVLHDRAGGSVRVLLREAVRVPVYLRRERTYVHPDPREYRSLVEVVAGMVEDDDPPGQPGLARRAAAESGEEAGLAVDAARFEPLGEASFASPGTGDEKVFFQAAEADLAERGEAAGDGSAMEEWSELHVLDLGEAIRRCRDGRIPDMKTEVALLRLADRVGYVPFLDRYVDRGERG